jgi:hypothetical protein
VVESRSWLVQQEQTRLGGEGTATYSCMMTSELVERAPCNRCCIVGWATTLTVQLGDLCMSSCCAPRIHM